MQVSAGSARDYFLVPESISAPNNFGNGNTNGRVIVPNAIHRPSTKVIITDGQSLVASSSTGPKYTPISNQVHNLNVYDGAIYMGADPVLGCSYHAAGIDAAPTGPNLHIGDRLIATGKAARVILVPLANASIWPDVDPSVPGSMFGRTRVAILRCRALGFDPDAIYCGRGEGDAFLGTPSNTIRDAGWAYVDAIRAMNCTCPVYVGIHSRLSTGPGGVNATTRAGLQAMVNVGRDIRAGFDCDTLEGTNRQTAAGDPVHLTTEGATNYGNAIADLMFP